jgi:predicted nucleic acid-binding protein
MKSKVYIETSVVSYYAGRASRDVVIAGRQQSTLDFWPLLANELSPFVSALVVKEAGKGNSELAKCRLDAIQSFPVLRTTPEAERLAQTLLDARAIPVEYPEDALHIAVAAIAGMDFIVTWNFAHINNPFTRMMIRHAVENAGYECPEVVSPDAFLGGET